MGFTPKNTSERDWLMTTITRTITTVEYVEITRTASEAPPIKATIVEPTRIVPPASAPRKGDIVEYYSQAGRRGEYRVSIVGQDGIRVELKGYNRKNGFWVDSAKCRFLRRAW